MWRHDERFLPPYLEHVEAARAYAPPHSDQAIA